MTTTSHIGITLVEQSQSQKEVTVNEALIRIDALLNTGAISRSVSTPPGSPASGDLYIVGSSPTGAWSGQAAQLAYFDQVWCFIAPREGMSLWVNDESLFYVYTGSSWTTGGNGSIALTGDVTGSGSSSIATSIGSGKVTNAMLAGSIAASKLIGTDIATVGTVTTGTWSGAFGAVSGANLTTLTAANISAGTAGINITGTAPAGTLTGTTLASNVVTSSLTTVGTIGTGVWQGTSVAVANGGTGATSAASARSNLGVAAVGGTYPGDATTTAQTITLIAYAPYAFTINSLQNLATVAGTVTGTLNINGTPVTGCSSLSLTSTPASATATGANSVAAGNTVTFVTTSPSSLTGLQAFSLIGTR